MKFAILPHKYSQNERIWMQSNRALVRILRVPVLKKILVKRGRGSFLHTHFYCIFMQQFFPEYVDLSKSSGAIAPVAPVLTRALFQSQIMEVL